MRQKNAVSPKLNWRFCVSFFEPSRSLSNIWSRTSRCAASESVDEQPEARRRATSGEVVVARETRAAGAERQVDGARHGAPAAEEHLAGQHVPADRQVVVA